MNNKISKYEEFLLEKEMQLLLEANIVIDDKFYDLLQKINSPISSLLSDLHGIEVDTNYNYITYDVDKEDKVFFTPDDKVKKAADYKTIKKSDMNVGRFVRAILTKAGIEVKPKELEDFVSKYKATILVEKEAFKRFEIVKGDDIKKWYLVDNYDKELGTLGSSCMRYAKCQEYLSIYSENPDKVSLIILKSSEDPDKITGRALLWLDDKDRKFMDRVYIINSADTQLFIDYAIDSGFYYKKNQTFNTGENIMFNGEELKREESWVTVTLENSEFDYYPYMDSLKYFQKQLSKHFQAREYSKLTSDYNSAYDAELTSTEGGDGSCDNCNGRGSYECQECSGGEVECYRCDGSKEEECGECEGSGVENCSKCDGEGEVSCKNCDGNGELDCEKCDGDGTNEEGDECSECEGKGKISCDDCHGDGRSTCDECDGECTVECTACKGGGLQECSKCDGEGTLECDECGGSGSIECYECN